MSGLTCPGCGAAAERTERFTLASTDGPVAHIAVSCSGGHHFRMAAEKLPASVYGPSVPRPRVVLGPGRPSTLSSSASTAGTLPADPVRRLAAAPRHAVRSLQSRTPHLHQRGTGPHRYDVAPCRALRQHPTLAEAVIAGEPDRAARLADSHFSLTDERSPSCAPACTCDPEGTPMPIARVNDIELNYKLEGDGEDTIVLINGLADDLETWVLQMDDFLAAGYRVLRFDNRGIGASSKPAAPRAGCSPTTRRPWPTRSALPASTLWGSPWAG